MTAERDVDRVWFAGLALPKTLYWRGGIFTVSFGVGAGKREARGPTLQAALWELRRQWEELQLPMVGRISS